MNRQIKKISLSLTLSCLFSDFSFGLTPCQNGYDYNHECDAYYNINLIQAKIDEKEDSVSRRVAANITKSKTSKIIALKNDYEQENLSYLETLRKKYANQFKGNMGLQALIDRSKYLSLKKIEDKNITKSTSKHVALIKNSLKSTKTKLIKNIKTKIQKGEISLVAQNVDELKAIKDIKLNRIKEKNIVALNKPKKQKGYILYTVKKGDSLIKIAKKYALSKNTLLKLNKLDKNATIKIGQKLKIPSQIRLAKKDKEAPKEKNLKDIYIVKKGDTLTKIAKKLGISIVRLREINKLSRSSRIKVGQKLYITPKFAKVESNRYDILKNIKFKKVPSFKFKRKIRVVATAYTSHKNQTDSTPFLAAWNNRIRPGMKIIAVSPDLIKKYGLTNGVKVKILGLPGYYVVRDKMNARLRNHIDIYMGVNKKKAMQWGRRRIVLYW